MNSFKWITGSLKNLRISGGGGGKVVQARLASNLVDQKEPIKPKRPLNPYLRYTQKIRDATVKANPKLKVTEIISVLAQQWNSLPQETKDAYAKEFQDEMVNYNEKYSSYKKSLSKEQLNAMALERSLKHQRKERMQKKKLEKEFGKPKRPITGFILFLQSQGQFKGSPREVAQQRVKDFGLKWRSMSDQEKAPYNEEYKKAAEVYKADLQKWKQKMAKLNDVDGVSKSSKSTGAEKKK